MTLITAPEPFLVTPHPLPTDPPASFFFFPPGLTLPLHTALAYIFAYAEGYTSNFRLAAAFPLAQSFAISLYHFLQDQ